MYILCSYFLFQIKPSSVCLFWRLAQCSRWNWFLSHSGHSLLQRVSPEIVHLQLQVTSSENYYILNIFEFQKFGVAPKRFDLLKSNYFYLSFNIWNLVKFYGRSPFSFKIQRNYHKIQILMSFFKNSTLNCTFNPPHFTQKTLLQFTWVFYHPYLKLCIVHVYEF